MEELAPSDSISQAGSRKTNQVYGAAPYPGPMYAQRHQHPAPYPQGQQYYPSYGAHVHAQGHPTYLPTPPPMLSPAYPHSASRSHHRGRTRSRHDSSCVSSSTPPGGHGSLYSPTSSYLGSGNTLVVPSTTQYSIPGASSSTRTRSYAAAANDGEHQAGLLQAPQPVYPHPPSSYGTRSATTSPSASPHAAETRALVPYSRQSAQLSRSPRSSSHSRSSSPQPSPTPSAQPMALTSRTEYRVVVLNAPRQTVFVNATPQYHQYYQYQYYPQEAEQRKSTFLCCLPGFFGHK